MLEGRRAPAPPPLKKRQKSKHALKNHHLIVVGGGWGPGARRRNEQLHSRRRSVAGCLNAVLLFFRDSAHPAWINERRTGEGGCRRGGTQFGKDWAPRVIGAVVVACHNIASKELLTLVAATQPPTLVAYFRLRGSTPFLFALPRLHIRSVHLTRRRFRPRAPLRPTIYLSAEVASWMICRGGGETCHSNVHPYIFFLFSFEYKEVGH